MLSEPERGIGDINEPLHVSSQDERNDEMGILVSKQDDSVLYEAIYREANRLLRAANRESSVSSASKPSACKPTRIYVGNLNFQASDQRSPRALFAARRGRVSRKSRSIRYSPCAPAGLGLLRCPTALRPQAAISALNGQEHQGRQLTVNEATERR